MLKLGFTLSKSIIITTASKHKSESLGSIEIPISYYNQTLLVQAFVFPNISPSVTSGVDFDFFKLCFLTIKLNLPKENR